MADKGKTIHTVSCGTCLYRKVDDGYEVLLVRPHRDRDVWGVPKGHIMEGETEEECAVRETIEETGITPIISHHRMSDVRVKHAYEHKTVKIWMALPDPEAPVRVDDGENVEIRWHHIDRLPAVHKYQIPLLAEISVFLKGR